MYLVTMVWKTEMWEDGTEERHTGHCTALFAFRLPQFCNLLQFSPSRYDEPTSPVCCLLLLSNTKGPTTRTYHKATLGEVPRNRMGKETILI